MQQMGSLFGSRKRQTSAQASPASSPPPTPPTKDNMPYLLIQWQDHTIPIYLLPKDYPRYTVADVKRYCKKRLHVPLATMTAKYNGGFLKDDNATLVSLGIRPYATIQLLGDAVNNQQVQQTASGNPEEVGCLLRIDAINTRIAALGKKAVELEHQVKAPPKDTHALTQSLNYLCEMLMKELMALDAVECPAAFATARQNRRNAVSKCQAMLDNIEQWKAQLQQAS